MNDKELLEQLIEQLQSYSDNINNQLSEGREKGTISFDDLRPIDDVRNSLEFAQRVATFGQDRDVAQQIQALRERFQAADEVVGRLADEDKLDQAGLYGSRTQVATLSKLSEVEPEKRDQALATLNKVRDGVEDVVERTFGTTFGSSGAPGDQATAEQSNNAVPTQDLIKDGELRKQQAQNEWEAGAAQRASGQAAAQQNDENAQLLQQILDDNRTLVATNQSLYDAVKGDPATSDLEDMALIDVSRAGARSENSILELQAKLDNGQQITDEDIALATSNRVSLARVGGVLHDKTSVELGSASGGSQLQDALAQSGKNIGVVSQDKGDVMSSTYSTEMATGSNLADNYSFLPSSAHDEAGWNQSGGSGAAPVWKANEGPGSNSLAGANANRADFEKASGRRDMPGDNSPAAGRPSFGPTWKSNEGPGSNSLATADTSRSDFDKASGRREMPGDNSPTFSRPSFSPNWKSNEGPGSNSLATASSSRADFEKASGRREMPGDNSPAAGKASAGPNWKSNEGPGSNSLATAGSARKDAEEARKTTYTGKIDNTDPDAGFNAALARANERISTSTSADRAHQLAKEDAEAAIAKGKKNMGGVFLDDAEKAQIAAVHNENVNAYASHAKQVVKNGGTVQQAKQQIDAVAAIYASGDQEKIAQWERFVAAHSKNKAAGSKSTQNKHKTTSSASAGVSSNSNYFKDINGVSSSGNKTSNRAATSNPPARKTSNPNTNFLGVPKGSSRTGGGSTATFM